MVMMLFSGEGGIARREECLWIVVGRGCFSSEVLGLTVAAGLGCVFDSEQGGSLYKIPYTYAEGGGRE